MPQKTQTEVCAPQKRAAERIPESEKFSSALVVSRISRQRPLRKADHHSEALVAAQRDRIAVALRTHLLRFQEVRGARHVARLERQRMYALAVLLEVLRLRRVRRRRLRQLDHRVLADRDECALLAARRVVLMEKLAAQHAAMELLRRAEVLHHRRDVRGVLDSERMA